MARWEVTVFLDSGKKVVLKETELVPDIRAYINHYAFEIEKHLKELEEVAI